MKVYIDNENERQDLVINLRIEGEYKDKLQVEIIQQKPPCGDFVLESHPCIELPQETKWTDR